MISPPIGHSPKLNPMGSQYKNGAGAKFPSQVQTTHEEPAPSPTTKGDRRRLPNNSPFPGHIPPMAAASPKSGASAVTASPIRFFLFFHDAVRSELDGLHRAAVASAADPRADARPLIRRCRFLRRMYLHHSDAEDEVTYFPAPSLRGCHVAVES